MKSLSRRLSSSLQEKGAWVVNNIFKITGFGAACFFFGLRTSLARSLVDFHFIAYYFTLNLSLFFSLNRHRYATNRRWREKNVKLYRLLSQYAWNRIKIKPFKNELSLPHLFIYSSRFFFIPPINYFIIFLSLIDL